MDRNNEQDTPHFDLPNRIENLLGQLSIYFGRKGHSLLQQILVNSRYNINEGVEYDNWNGGIWFHELVFQVPTQLFYEIFDNTDSACEEIKNGLNRLYTNDDERISVVGFELQDDGSLANWRENSGLLLHSGPLHSPTSETELQRLWTPGFLRVFLSHKSEFKVQTAQLKNHLSTRGVSCFVAHEDIEPTKEWQNEIENALFSAHVLVPLLTEEFHQSSWTDQEIGIAIGRSIPVVSVKLGTDPYGFIGKYQAIRGDLNNPSDLATALFESFASHEDLKDLTTEGLLTRFEQSESFDETRFTFGLLEPYLPSASPTTIKRIEKAFSENTQIQGCYTVQKRLPELLKKLKVS